MKALRFAIPLAIFGLIVFFLYRGLGKDPRELPSPLIDKPAPAFTLPLLDDPAKTFSPADYRGKVWLLNVWGSWCSSCTIEHPTLMALQKRDLVPIVGFDWKDKPEAARRWLAQNGNPYPFSVIDLEGRSAIDWGVYGAPETFLIDKEGVVRYKYTGPLDDRAVEEKLLPIIRKYQQ